MSLYAQSKYLLEKQTTWESSEYSDGSPASEVQPKIPTYAKSTLVDERDAQPAPFVRSLFDGESEPALYAFLKIYVFGCAFLVLLIFTVLPIYWGSMWRIASGRYSGWVVDFDGAAIGSAVAQALTSQSVSSPIIWRTLSASQLPGGAEQLQQMILGQQAWIAVSINQNATDQLNQALATPNATYDGSAAISVIGVESRNELAYRNVLLPTARAVVDDIVTSFALLLANQTANVKNLNAILTTSPQTLIRPVSYRIVNLAPFNVSLLSVLTLIGLLYQSLFTYFITIFGETAREKAGLTRSLSLPSLVLVRLGSAGLSYLFISLAFSILSVAFQLNVSLIFKDTGFLLFWMVNYVGMLAIGLPVEAMITILTARFVSFFVLLWIVCNISVIHYPLDALPGIFRYGYAMPFYNMSVATRSILRGTYNQILQNLVVLIAWIAISSLILIYLQWYTRKRDGKREFKQELRAQPLMLNISSPDYLNYPRSPKIGDDRGGRYPFNPRDFSSFARRIRNSLALGLGQVH